MCGLFGKFGQNETFDGDEVEEQFQLIAARGPDGRGITKTEKCILGHTLLAIQDPGNAIQPMYSKSGKSLIVFNGEIYNFKELINRFQMTNLRSLSDTEVVLELIESNGTQIIDWFEGMFAFAFLNIEHNQITLCRDRYGEKPLFYSIDDASLYFASNPISVQTMTTKAKDINLDALPHFFKYQYLPEGSTLYSGIHQVIPGTSVTFNLDLQQELRVLGKKLVGQNRSFKSVFSTSVKACAVSDVPIGLSLSGGVDSTVTLCELKNVVSKVKTFTISFDENDADTKFARKASELFTTEHHEIIIEDSELPSLIYEVLRKQPLPFGDSSVVPSFALAKYAKKFVKVLISGDGADEILSGYEYYRKYGYKTRNSVKLYLEYLKLQFEVRAKLKLYGRKDYSRINRIRELEFILSIKSALELWHEDIAVLDPKELKLLGFSKGDSRKISRQQYSEFRGIQSVMFWDQVSYLPGDILWKSDTAGMMASLEIRTPFLNSEVVHFASQIEFTKDFSKQTFLRSEYRDQIPDEFFTRRKKGFGAPLSKWLALPEVNCLYMDFVENRKSNLYKYLDFDTFSKASDINSQTKWNMLALAVWLDENG